MVFAHHLRSLTRMSERPDYIIPQLGVDEDQVAHKSAMRGPVPGQRIGSGQLLFTFKHLSRSMNAYISLHICVLLHNAYFDLGF